MTPQQDFAFKLISLFATIVGIPLVGVLVAYLMKRITLLGVAIDGAQDTMKELREEIGRLKGEKAGVAQEKAEQALRNTVPVNPVSVPTATNPLLTEDKAKELMENQTVTADKGRGWSPPTEPPGFPIVGSESYPLQTDELFRQRNQGETQ